LTIIGGEHLSEFKSDNAAKKALNVWRTICESTEWKDFTELRCQFPNADQVGRCVVFNVRGNRYRLIAQINYRMRLVNVRHVLTHKEYDRGRWKDGCGC
jgi:mRNA interferase HigB